LLGDPDFLQRRRNFAPISRDSQTDDRRDDRFVTLTLTVCEPKKLLWRNRSRYQLPLRASNYREI